MEEGGTVADPPVAKPAGASKSEGAVGSETLPTPTQIPDPTLKPEVIKEEEEDAKPAAGGVGSQAQSKKRKLGSIDELRNSTYFKIRSIIRDLRPLFIEVIHAPDFRESKAAHDIRKQMKTMLELTKQLRNEVSVAKPKKSEEQPLPGASKEEKHEERENHVPQDQNGDVPSSSSDKTRENAPTFKDKNPAAAEENIPEAKESAQQLEEGSQGTYVIGGSPVGWNFLVYPGSNTIYYGVTKESGLVDVTVYPNREFREEGQVQLICAVTPAQKISSSKKMTLSRETALAVNLCEPHFAAAVALKILSICMKVSLRCLYMTSSRFLWLDFC